MTEWEYYWKRKNLKKSIIELARKYYFAPLFANIVKKNVIKGPILEAGCGSCEILYRLSRNYKVAGVDNSKIAVESARKRFNFFVELADIKHLPFKDSSFELIFNQGVMEHFSDIEMNNILIEFARIARKVLIFIPSNVSIFKIYNPFDVDDTRFLSPSIAKKIVSKVFPKVTARYIIKSFFITMLVYGELD